MKLRWLRFDDDGKICFGTLEGKTITVYQGDMFDSPEATGKTLDLADVRLLTPTVPGKMIALWNNFNALSKKMGVAKPAHPLYFLKASNSFLATGETIRRPFSYHGKVVYEGELGIVIGKPTRNADEATATASIFGYTCINDVTAGDLISIDKTFAQWTRSKSFDTFGVFGPVVATGLDPATLSVHTVLNGDERQNYKLADMIIPPARLVSLLSNDMTLEPGDVICCGTSLGVGSMKEPHNIIEITIEGIGTLSNVYQN
jgi:2-keto-4-pentenoate hydratase/2-oxohepta-3-ene-1,7-dioic acid hydratase in catechol pathway